LKSLVSSAKKIEGFSFIARDLVGGKLNTQMERDSSAKK